MPMRSKIPVRDVGRGQCTTNKILVESTKNGFDNAKPKQKRHRSSWDEITKSDLYYELSNHGYYIEKCIGEGSYSKVYYAQYVKKKKERIFACKIIDRRNTSDDFCEKFLPREIAALKVISHDNIVGIHSVLEMGPFVCFFMDYCPYGDLLERIRTKGPLSEKRANLFFQQICAAVRYLHSKNISHRDIKCENVLIQSKSWVKLTDFGFSKMHSDDKIDDISHTFCGSSAYAAPEVLKGIPYDPKLYDMWSLGCVLFVMVCGSMPFDDDNIPRTIRKQESHRITFPSGYYLDYKIKHLISQLLHPDVKKRYSSDNVFKHPWIRSMKQEKIETKGA